MPSSSARCAQLPRAADKVPFYAALKKFRDFLNGLIPHMEESECVFTEQRIRQCCESQDLNKAVTVTLSDVKCSDDPAIASNLNIDAQQSSHMFSDRNNVEGGTETTKQVIDKLYPHLNTNISNERDEFVYSAANRIPTTAPMIAGSRPDTMSDTDYMSVFESHQQQQQQQQPPPEKKKRGRPKKLKGQEIIDPATGNKITISGQSIPHHNFNNILNLSMITASDNSLPIVHRSAGNSNAENTTKKKRGRPKKVKPMLENMLTTSVKQVNTKPSTNLIGTQQTPPQTTLITSSMHPSLSMEHISSPQSNHQAPSLYNTPPPSHMLYTASASPMASPALNCSYSHSHGTPPVQVQVEHNIQMNADHPVPATGTVGIRDQPHLGETPPPSSPNMCAVVDFDPPNERTNDELETGEAAHAHAHEHHYQQWLSPKAQQASQASPVTVSTYPQTDQQQATVQYPSSAQEQQEQHWQSYEEHSAHNSSYMLASPQQQQQHHHINLNNTQQVQSQVVTDVSRKSLSGLESLVDQIPSISEQESNVLSSATAAAAAAAVENRLIGLQQQQQQELQKQRCQQQLTEPQSQSTTGSNNVLNSNFSVSNLVTNSSMHLLHNNNNNNSSSGRPESEENSKKNNNNIIEYLSNSPHTHTHASNHLISAALVAATVGNAAQPGTQTGQQHHHSIAAQHTHPHAHAHPHAHTHPHAHAHTQMYMDHTHHITSHMAHIPPPPVNTMYAAPPYAAQHGGSAAEYGHAGHYSVQGATPTLHVPSPNYPYTHYGHHTPPQSNYPSFAHAHPHHHHHGHASHHLSVFERLKPSDISGYSGF